MDCGIPFCHGCGCPLANRIPEFNDLVYRGQWQRGLRGAALDQQLPGDHRAASARRSCEAACTLAINDQPVTIRQIELQIVERGWQEGWIKPQPARTQHAASAWPSSAPGPAGLAAAQQLARAGHDVVVFEKDDRIGGLLRYGIPDFKLEKWVLDRRLEQMRAEGVEFETGVDVGEDISAALPAHALRRDSAGRRRGARRAT